MAKDVERGRFAIRLNENEFKWFAFGQSCSHMQTEPRSTDIVHNAQWQDKKTAKIHIYLRNVCKVATSY